MTALTVDGECVEALARAEQSEAQAGAMREAFERLHLHDGKIADCDEWECGTNLAGRPLCAYCASVTAALSGDAGRALLDERSEAHAQLDAAGMPPGTLPKRIDAYRVEVGRINGRHAAERDALRAKIEQAERERQPLAERLRQLAAAARDFGPPPFKLTDCADAMDQAADALLLGAVKTAAHHDAETCGDAFTHGYFTAIDDVETGRRKVAPSWERETAQQPTAEAADRADLADLLAESAVAHEFTVTVGDVLFPVRLVENDTEGWEWRSSNQQANELPFFADTYDAAEDGARVIRARWEEEQGTKP